MILTRTFCIVIVVMLYVLGCSRQESARSSPIGGLVRNEFERDSARWLDPSSEHRPTYAVESYALRGKIDWETRKMQATVAISFRWNDDGLKEIALDSQVPKVFAVSEESKALHFVIDEAKGLLRIDLDRLRPQARQRREATILVSYEANAAMDERKNSSPLHIITARAGGVTGSRVAYTSSEPRGVDEWMPCHNAPSERARFSAEFTMDEDERLIANGDLLLDEMDGHHRRMKYGTRYTLPTYLMAFALGELVEHTEFHGALPVSVWARRGVSVDFRGMVTETIREISLFEKILTPFPFEKYALVLLPEFFAEGIEHAGISFVSENHSGEPMLNGDRELAAHELAHQWFGDFMTIETWDDLWVKESMATLLAQESRRPWEDRDGKARLFGRTFQIDDGMAMRDTSLAAEAKYTSGPYARGAWFMTQLRAVLGEEAFWKTLRKILGAHPYGVINGDEFIQGFAGVVSDGMLARMHDAVSAKKMPRLELKAGNLELLDPDRALLAPFVVNWYARDGLHAATLEPGHPLAIPTKDVLFVIDPQDVHAWPSFVEDGDVRKILLPLQVPRDPQAVTHLLHAGAAAQISALQVVDGWTLEPEEFAGLYAGLGSERAKLQALDVACERAHKVKEDHDKWAAVIERTIAQPPYLSLSEQSLSHSLGRCRGVLPNDYFAKELAKLSAFPAKPGIGFPQLAWIAAFATDAASAFGPWGALATHGPSIRARILGYTQLRKHLKAIPGYEVPTSADLEKWEEFLRESVKTSDVAEVVVAAAEALGAARDSSALPELAAIVRDPAHVNVAREALCAAAEITEGKPDKWKEFVKTLEPLEDLPAKLRAYIDRPDKCEEPHLELGDDD